MTDSQTILALTAACIALALLWLHAEYRRFALGAMSRAALKELNRLHPKH